MAKSKSHISKVDYKTPITPEIAEEIDRQINWLSKRSKKVCAVCGTEFSVIRSQMKKTRWRFVVMNCEYKHPKLKSRKIKVCNACVWRWFHGE